MFGYRFESYRVRRKNTDKITLKEPSGLNRISHNTNTLPELRRTWDIYDYALYIAFQSHWWFSKNNCFLICFLFAGKKKKDYIKLNNLHDTSIVHVNWSLIDVSFHISKTKSHCTLIF